MSTKNTAVIFFMCSLIFANPGSANPILAQVREPNHDRLAHHAKRLRKISVHVRGESPSQQEYNELERIVNSHSDQAPELRNYFQNKIRNYLQSDSHIDKMIERVLALMNFGSPGLSSLKNIWINPQQRIYSISRANKEFDHWRFPFSSSILLMVDRMVRFNEPWDQLAIANRYEFLPYTATAPTEFPRIRTFKDLNYYSAIIPVESPLRVVAPALTHPQIRPTSGSTGSSLPLKHLLNPQTASFILGGDSAKTVEVVGSQEDPRLAGLITHWSFVGRYGDNPLNHTRKRAAAIYRIFLCDEMTPAISTSDEAEQSLLERIQGLVRATQPVASDTPHGTQLREGQHASDPACASCHSKLDPLAQSLQGMGSIFLHSKPSGGKLSFNRQNGTRFEVTAEGIGTLMRELVQTPEYEACQVNHFWNWFVGREISLADSKKNQLAQIFSQSNHRINNLIEAILLSEEFFPSISNQGILSGDQIARQMLFGRVRPILAKCDQCHEAMPGIPPFNRMQIGNTDASHRMWATRIQNAIQTRMPPPNAGWSLSSQDRIALLEWLNVTLGLGNTNAPIAVQAPSFDLGFKRYFNGADFLRNLYARIQEHWTHGAELELTQSTSPPFIALVENSDSLAPLGFFTATGIPEASNGLAALRQPGDLYLNEILNESRFVWSYGQSEVNATTTDAEIIQRTVRALLDVRTLTNLERENLAIRLRLAAQHYQHLSNQSRAMAILNELLTHEYFLTY